MAGTDTRMNRYDYGRWFGAVLAVVGVGYVVRPESMGLSEDGYPVE